MSTRDRGTVSLFTVMFAPAVILLVGLVFDGGLAIHARQRAADIAEQAARAGADDIDVAALRAGNPRPTVRSSACGKARSFASAYPELRGGTVCRVTGGDTVHVTVRLDVKPKFLSIVPGFGTFTMESTASAHPDDGNP